MPLPTAYFASNRTKDVDVNIESYVDADFANSVDDRHSIYGYAFMLAGGQLAGHSVQWKQNTWRQQRPHRKRCSYDFYWKRWVSMWLHPLYFARITRLASALLIIQEIIVTLNRSTTGTTTLSEKVYKGVI